MPRHPLTGASTLDDIDDFFSIKPVVTPKSGGRSAVTPQSAGRSVGTKYPANGASEAAASKPDRIRGRLIDEFGNPVTAERFTVSRERAQPSYQLERAKYQDGTAYIGTFKGQAERESAEEGLSHLVLDDTASIDRLETRSMTGSTVSSRFGQLFHLPMQNDKAAYSGYRQTVYNNKLPITAHREKLIQTIESTQCTIIQGSTGCGKTTQVPQYILDEYAKGGRRCRIAVTQPRRIAAISIAKRVCHERGWTEGTYCGYQVARDSKLDMEKTMITYMTTGILLQKLIKEKSLNNYTHIILDEVHERDQDTDLALLIVKKFIHTVSPTVKVILMSATFDCQIFADYFATEIRGCMQRAPVYNVDGKGFNVQEIYWSDPPLNNMLALPRFDDSEPAASPAAMAISVKLMYEFDRLEHEEQKEEVAHGKPLSRGTVLVFLPGLAEIQDLHTLLEKEQGLKGRKLTILPLHSSITLEEQSKVFDIPHVLYRKVILSTNIAESSITVPDIKYVIDFCLTKCLSTDTDTNMTCLRLEWASKASCKQRMGRAGRVSNGRVYRLVHKAFYVNHLMDYGAPEMTRCPLSQLILRVKLLGPQEPRYILSTALDPPDMDGIGKSILLLKEAGALADPKDKSKYNPFDGELTFVGNVLASLPLSIQLGKLLVFGHMLGLLPECLIIAAAMHTRSIFIQPFKKKVESFSHKIRWDRGMHSDPIATVNAYKEWDRLKTEEYFLNASSKESKWCYEHFLQKKTLYEVREVINDLTKRLELHNIRVRQTARAPHLRNTNDPAQELLLLKVALACAFYPHYFGHHSQDEKDATKTLSGKSPLNAVYIKNIPNNQGILYKRQVEKLLLSYLPTAKIHASFENTKCYVEFEHAPGDCGVIPNSMYVSLLLPLQRERLQISLYDSRQATEMMQRIQDVQREAARSEGRLDTNRMYSNKDMKLKSDTAKAPAIPNTSISVMELIISHVEECAHFWGQKVDMRNELDKEHVEMNQVSNLAQASAMYNPVVGSLCIAPYMDAYYRAKIKAISGDAVQLYFVDFGNTESLPVSDVKQLLPQFRQLPFQAIECALTHLAPPHSAKAYPPQVNEVFSQMVLHKQVYCKIYSVDNGVLRIEKMADVQAQHIGYHDLLIGKNMAKISNESFTSKQNHKLRYYNAASLSSSEQESDEWGFGVEDQIANLSQSHQIQTLSGPTSPIELRFFTYATSGAMKEVRVDSSSVNAVALDETPGDTHDRLMVSASMSVNAAGSRIIARETTLMPNIHGLPALMSLLFAPSIQIRRDSQKKSYTGAICGLGQDPGTGGPAFADHDMEIVFDTEIGIEDLLQINKVRMGFNYCLGDEQWDDTVTSKFQSHIRKSLLELLNKDRSSREKVFYLDRLVWKTLDESDILKHGLEDTAADQLHLFRLISAPILEDSAALSAEKQQNRSRAEYLRTYCQNLTMLASASVNNPLDMACELCNVHISSHRELQVHLNSKTHRAYEHSLFGRAYAHQ